jgi:hypothetical protein
VTAVIPCKVMNDVTSAEQRFARHGSLSAKRSERNFSTNEV